MIKLKKKIRTYLVICPPLLNPITQLLKCSPKHPPKTPKLILNNYILGQIETENHKNLLLIDSPLEHPNTHPPHPYTHSLTQNLNYITYLVKLSKENFQNLALSLAYLTLPKTIRMFIKCVCKQFGDLYI